MSIVLEKVFFVAAYFDHNYRTVILVDKSPNTRSRAAPQALRHPNVVQFLGACMLPPNLCMVTENLPHSLHAVIHNPKVDLDKKRVVALAQDMCRSLVYLHSR